MPSQSRHVGPLDFPNPLDVDRVDLTAVGGTKYSSGMLDVRKYFIFTAIINIIESSTTPATGDMTLRLKILAKDKATVLWFLDILTLIDTSNDAQQEVLVFGAGAEAKLLNSSSGTLSGDADVFKTAQFMEVELEITTQADGDTAANVNLLMEG